MAGDGRSRSETVGFSLTSPALFTSADSLVIGANDNRDRATSFWIYGPTIPRSIFTPDATAPDPMLTADDATTEQTFRTSTRTHQTGVYGKARVKIVDRPTVMTGGRRPAELVWRFGRRQQGVRTVRPLCRAGLRHHPRAIGLCQPFRHLRAADQCRSYWPSAATAGHAAGSSARAAAPCPDRTPAPHDRDHRAATGNAAARTGSPAENNSGATRAAGGQQRGGDVGVPRAGTAEHASPPSPWRDAAPRTGCRLCPLRHGPRGKVLSTRLERPGGVPDLDRDPLALPRHAPPLPKPPEDRPGDTLEPVVPIEFFPSPR